ncbi:Metallophos domain-containing protein [Mycena indigotica]|uniref:Metallophos domain-containing protein n=1 Tax=Mycena indigotica TaxID=2126181 RepID=A0A8H6S9L3_9AGAR|nr:Metallophos domain-containing protein [Mycena indigotica]KAF7295363.1 Metallophos domain-containing protein [Mycena indigotica]
MRSLIVSLALAGAVVACGDDHIHARDGHDHSHTKREFPTAKLTPPTRPLQWGTLNIIHTTDSHGWLLGHQKTSFPEPNYSGDLGDFASFVTHMKEIAKAKDVDLLLVDSGDLHDGTGLSDGFPPGGIDAQASNEFYKQLPYDVMAIGNHELYIYNNTLDMYRNFAPHFKGRYLSSNVNITIDGVSRPVGGRFAKFTTRKGRKITALGVLFNFKGNAANTTVQPVADMVKEAWFSNAIAEEPDVFLLAGHMPIAKDNWPLVFDAIRAVHPTTPILILGGHTHIRDCLQLDGRSMSLESGRYMETVGWMSADLPAPKGHQHGHSTKNITFSRRYLDPNRVTYEYHTGRGNFSFDTAWGRSITKGLEKLAKTFDLSFQYGTAPHDFTINQAPYPSNNSVLSLVSEVMPYSLTVNNTRAGNPNIMITNSGSLRFDLYAGPFTKNDQLTVSPFADSFLYLTVPFGAAKKVLPTLNHAGADERRSLETELWARGYVETRYREWIEEMYRRDIAQNGAGLRAAGNLTVGYVTSDACPGVGDDTPHVPLAFNPIPDFISSAPPDVSDDTIVDLVFVDFIQTQLLSIVNSVQSAKVFTTADVLPYTNVLATEILGIYAQHAWN